MELWSRVVVIGVLALVVLPLAGYLGYQLGWSLVINNLDVIHGSR